MNTEPFKLAAEQRPLALRLRADLQRTQLSLAGVEYHVLHDATTGQHFQLREEEFALLSQLNGRVSLSELRTYFTERFAPQRIGAARLQAFLAQAYRGGLLISEYANQGRSLWQRAQEQRGRRFLNALVQIFQWRIVRFDPSALLAWVSPPLVILYSRSAACVWFVGLFMTLGIVLIHRHAMWEQLPHISQWLRAEHFPLLVISLLIAKSWHELGHAVACVRWGVRCREMGVQLMFGVPCLYCDTTVSWQLADKWKRMGISAGGLYFEGFLAAMSALVYHITLPGVIHDLSLNLLFVCTLGTLLVNANPLLRFDGYYLLADGLEIANLEARAKSHARAALEWLCFGGELRVLGPFEQHLSLRLVFLGCAMLAYRLLLLGGLMWGLRSTLLPAQLAPLADVLCLLIALSVLLPLIVAESQAREPFTGAEKRRTWLQIMLPLFAIIIAFVCWVPLPTRVMLSAVLEPEEKQNVYAAVPGCVVETVSPGQRVKQGERLVQLENHEFTREIELLESAAVEQALLIEQAEGAMLIHHAAANQIPAARESLRAIRERLVELKRYVARLEISAPREGIVLSPPQRVVQPSKRELATWSGSPLDVTNRGAFLDTGTMLCEIADENTFTAAALIDQADANRIQVGSPVRLKFAAISPILEGEVLELARVAVDDLPPALRALQRPKHAGNQNQQVDYWVRIRVLESPAKILPGMRCSLSITAAPETLFAKWQRWYERTIRFAASSSGAAL